MEFAEDEENDEWGEGAAIRNKREKKERQRIKDEHAARPRPLRTRAVGPRPLPCKNPYPHRALPLMQRSCNARQALR